MSNFYLKFVGKMACRPWYSIEQNAFLKSGYICQKCGKTLIGAFGKPEILCFDSEGQIVKNLLMYRLKGKEFGCPKCEHRWRIS